MKRFIAILLISSFIGGTLHLDELVKIPFLLQHYSEHKAKHPNDTTFDFLYKHYVLNQNAESEKDSNSDSQMPFKSTHNFHSHIAPFTCENKTLKIVIETGLVSYLGYDDAKILSRPFDIWQPPRI